LELSVDEYQSLTPLGIRQAIHREYSVPPDRLEEMTFDAVDLSPTDAVVDIGPGTGSFLTRFVAAGHAGTIAALDRSMAAARAVDDVGGLLSLQGDACDLPFPDRTFEVVFARHMLYHVADVSRALREFRRVLRPGGKCVTVVNHAEQAPRLSDLLRRSVRVNGIRPPALPRVDSTNLPALIEPVFGNVGITRFDGHLVFHRPEPVIALGAALLGFYGIAPDSALRAEIEARLGGDVRSWFARSNRPWRDAKGFVICVSTRKDLA
jgi:SAM-dependent methyltransferase